MVMIIINGSISVFIRGLVAVKWIRSFMSVDFNGGYFSRENAKAIDESLMCYKM